MTCYGQNQVMKTVGIADLKAHLSQYLRRVRTGRSLTVVDRETPIAQIVPYRPDAPLEVRQATRKPKDVRASGRLPVPTDSVSVLLQDRASR